MSRTEPDLSVGPGLSGMRDELIRREPLFHREKFGRTHQGTLVPKPNRAVTRARAGQRTCVQHRGSRGFERERRLTPVKCAMSSEHGDPALC
jgi:hypothetical protein